MIPETSEFKTPDKQKESDKSEPKVVEKPESLKQKRKSLVTIDAWAGKLIDEK